MVFVGFGRKMYTDYEIVCKVRSSADNKPASSLQPTSHLILNTLCISSRLTFPPLNSVTPSSDGDTLTSKPSATYSSANPHESTSLLSLAKYSRTGSRTKLLKGGGKGWRGS